MKLLAKLAGLFVLLVAIDAFFGPSAATGTLVIVAVAWLVLARRDRSRQEKAAQPTAAQPRAH